MANHASTDPESRPCPRRALQRYLSCASSRAPFNRAAAKTAVHLIQSLRDRIPDLRRHGRPLSLPYPRPHITIESEFKHETHFEPRLDFDFNPDLILDHDPDLDLDPDVAIDLEAILDLSPDIGLELGPELDSPGPSSPEPSTPRLNLTPSPLTRPPPLILYTTLIQELRFPPASTSTNPPSYTLSIDRTTPSLTDANDRLVVITRCNVTLHESPPDILHAGFDRLTGCRWACWTTDEDPHCRFFGKVERLLLQGPLLEADDGPEDVPQTPTHGKAPAALMTEAQARHCFAASKDLPGHIWVVAIHRPPSSSPPALSGRYKYPRRPTGSEAPDYTPWKLDSLHPVSGNALARAKDLWRKEFSHEYGRAERREMGCGFARWELHHIQKPSTDAPLVIPATPTSPTSIASNLPLVNNIPSIVAGPVIRIERLPLTAAGEMTSPHLPPAAIRFDKPFQPLCPERVFVPQSPVEQAVEEVFYAQDLTADEEVEELGRRLREQYLADNKNDNGGGSEVESPCKDKARRKGKSRGAVKGEEAGLEACRPGDVGVEEAGGRVGKPPVGRERRGLRGRLYHAMLK